MVDGITITLTKQEWDDLDCLVDTGASYDGDGCCYSATDERNDIDKRMMAAVRKFKAQLIG